MKDVDLKIKLKRSLQELAEGNENQVCQAQTFLTQLLDEALWPSFGASEKQLIAEAFACWGEWLLEKNPSPHSPEPFIAAATLLPEDPFILMREAVAYVKKSQELTLWKVGAQLVKRSLIFLPKEFLAWRLLGQIYEKIGSKEQDLSTLEEAKNCYFHAASLCEMQSDDYSNILWDQAKIALAIGLLSQEASDIHSAIEYFKKAETLGVISASFYIDFGQAYEALNHLIERKELQVLALECYQKAVQNEPSPIELQLHLAFFAQQLYEQTNLEEHFFIAQKAFNLCQEPYAQDPLFLCKYAMLLAIHGKRKEEPSQLESSLELFSKAHSLASDNAIILTRWAEVLVTCGVEEQEYEWLRLAEKKMENAIKLCSDNAEIWAMYGYCLTELGHYFNDASYHKEAVKKFQHALNLEPNNPRFLHGKALALLALGGIEPLSTTFEEAEKLFEQASFSSGMFKPEFWIDWGIVLMRLAELTMQVNHAQAAVDKFKFAIKQHSPADSHEVASARLTPIEWLYNYGCALGLLADFQDEPLHYEHSIQILNLVVEADAHFINARYNLALALFHLGELVSDVECFSLAEEQFKILIEADPEDAQVYEEWGSMLLHQALLMQEPAWLSYADDLYNQAESLLLKAVALGSTSSYYNLACLNSLKENYETAIKYIIKAAQAKTLPSLEDLLQDEWLEGLRAQPLFRRLLFDLASQQVEDAF